MIVVSDTSAITSLIQINRPEILSELYREVYIPDSVHAELLQAHSAIPTFIRRRSVSQGAEVQRLGTELDSGEAEAIVLAKELRADELLMDEAKGRRVAIREGLRVIGLLGVLLEAKSRGYIQSVRQITMVLEKTAGFYVNDDVKALIFRAAREN